MAMTKEQVLAVASLTATQKERATEWFKAAFRTQPKGAPRKAENEITLEVANVTALKEFLNELIKKHNKRVEANDKKKAAKAADEEKLLALKELVESAKEFDMNFDDVVEAVKQSFKEKKNAAIREQIAALQAQLVD